MTYCGMAAYTAPTRHCTYIDSGAPSQTSHSELRSQVARSQVHPYHACNSATNGLKHRPQAMPSWIPPRPQLPASPTCSTVRPVINASAYSPFRGWRMMTHSWKARAASLSGLSAALTCEGGRRNFTFYRVDKARNRFKRKANGVPQKVLFLHA